MRPLELAQACEDAGAAFARQGMTGQARPLLDQAIEIYERLDAARDLARAEAVLRAAGLVAGGLLRSQAAHAAAAPAATAGPPAAAGTSIQPAHS